MNLVKFCSVNLTLKKLIYPAKICIKITAKII